MTDQSSKLAEKFGGWGTIIALATLTTGMFYTYGQLAQKVDNINANVERLRNEQNKRMDKFEERIINLTVDTQYQGKRLGDLEKKK